MTQQVPAVPGPADIMRQLGKIDAQLAHVDKLLADADYRSEHGIAERQLPGFRQKRDALHARYVAIFETVPDVYKLCPYNFNDPVMNFAH